MGLTYADLTLTNRLSGQKVQTRALVDTGAMYLCVSNTTAVQLGFDPEEAETVNVTVADGRTVKVPKIDPVRIEFENRKYVTEAFVIGNETLLGVVPIEAMDLVVDPVAQKLKVNPEHPNYPVFPVK